MNNKGQIISVLLAFIFLIAFMVGILGWIHNDGAKENCKRLQSYNINASIVQIDWLNKECIVHMTDGTNVSSYDFNIAAVKTPLQLDNRGIHE